MVIKLGLGLEVLFVILAIEAVTHIITKADIFSWLQQWAEPQDNFIKKLFSCAYCLSVWVAAFMVLGWYAVPSFMLFVYIFAAHRLANLFHTFYDGLCLKVEKMKDERLRE